MGIILKKMDDMLYTWLLIYLLAGSGIYFSIRTRFVQIRLFRNALACMMEKKDGDKGVSSFQALMIATASRVGTGNMAGVATAIILGGPRRGILDVAHGGPGIGFGFCREYARADL